jgi:hypothetical protein
MCGDFENSFLMNRKYRIDEIPMLVFLSGEKYPEFAAGYAL